MSDKNLNSQTAFLAPQFNLPLAMPAFHMDANSNPTCYLVQLCLFGQLESKSGNGKSLSLCLFLFLSNFACQINETNLLKLILTSVLLFNFALTILILWYNCRRSWISLPLPQNPSLPNWFSPYYYYSIFLHKQSDARKSIICVLTLLVHTMPDGPAPYCQDKSNSFIWSLSLIKSQFFMHLPWRL